MSRRIELARRAKQARGVRAAHRGRQRRIEEPRLVEVDDNHGEAVARLRHQQVVQVEIGVKEPFGLHRVDRGARLCENVIANRRIVVGLYELPQRHSAYGASQKESSIERGTDPFDHRAHRLRHWNSALYRLDGYGKFTEWARCDADVNVAEDRSNQSATAAAARVQFEAAVELRSKRALAI